MYVNTRVSTAPEAAILAYFDDCAVACTPEYLHGRTEPAVILLSRLVTKMAVVCSRNLRSLCGVFRASLGLNVRYYLYLNNFGGILSFFYKFIVDLFLKLISFAAVVLTSHVWNRFLLRV